MNKLRPIYVAVIILGACFVFGSALISSSINRLMHNIPNGTVNLTNLTHSMNEIIYAIDRLNKAQNDDPLTETENDVLPDSMTLTQASQYLQITVEQLKQLIEVEKADIPYLKIDNYYIFNKAALEEWMKTGQKEYKMSQ